MASFTWKKTDQENTHFGDWGAGTATIQGSTFTCNLGSLSSLTDVKSVQTITYKCYHTCTNTSATRNIKYTLNFKNGNSVSLGTLTWDDFTSSGASTQTYKKSWSNPSSQNSMGTNVASGLKSVTATFEANSSNNNGTVLYYKATSSQPITITVTCKTSTISTIDTSKAVQYYSGEAFIAANVYYYSNGAWEQAQANYYSSGWKSCGI